MLYPEYFLPNFIFVYFCECLLFWYLTVLLQKKPQKQFKLIKLWLLLRGHSSKYFVKEVANHEKHLKNKIEKMFSTDVHSVLSYLIAGFYEPVIRKVHPPICRIAAKVKSVRSNICIVKRISPHSLERTSKFIFELHFSIWNSWTS